MKWIFMLLMIIATSAQAEIYKCVTNGKVLFSNSKCSGESVEKLDISEVTNDYPNKPLYFKPIRYIGKESSYISKLFNISPNVGGNLTYEDNDVEMFFQISLYSVEYVEVRFKSSTCIQSKLYDTDIDKYFTKVGINKNELRKRSDTADYAAVYDDDKSRTKISLLCPANGMLFTLGISKNFYKYY